MNPVNVPFLSVFPAVSGQATCPVCTGVLLHCGGQQRCTRCQFSICQGCGDGVGSGMEGDFAADAFRSNLDFS